MATMSFEADMLNDHQTALRRYAAYLVCDPEWAEDILQEVNIQALTSRPSFEAHNQLRAWLRTVLKNVAFKQVRDRKRYQDRKGRVASVAEEAQEADPVVSAQVRLEIHQHLLDQLQCLKPIYRDTLVARFFEGKSLQAIADEAGVGREAIKSRLERGIQKLRVLLDRRTPGGREAWLGALVPLLTNEDLTAIGSLAEKLGATQAGALGTTAAAPVAATSSTAASWLAAGILGTAALTAIGFELFDSPEVPAAEVAQQSESFPPGDDGVLARSGAMLPQLEDDGGPTTVLASTGAPANAPRQGGGGGGAGTTAYEPWTMELRIVDSLDSLRRTAGITLTIQTSETTVYGVTDATGAAVIENVIGYSGTISTSEPYLHGNVPWTVDDPENPGTLRIAFSGVQAFPIRLVTETGTPWTTYLDSINATPRMRAWVQSIGILAAPSAGQVGPWVPGDNAYSTSLLDNAYSRYHDRLAPTVAGRHLELKQSPPTTLHAIFMRQIVASQALTAMPTGELDFTVPTQFLTDRFSSVTFQLQDATTSLPISASPEVHMSWGRDMGGNRTSDLSDSSGVWTLSPVPVGTPRMRLSVDGYEPFTQELDVTSTGPLALGAISLQPQVTALTVIKRINGQPVTNGILYFVDANDPTTQVAESQAELPLEQNAEGMIFWAPTLDDLLSDGCAIPVAEMTGGTLPSGIDVDIPSAVHRVQFVCTLPVGSDPAQLTVTSDASGFLCATVPFKPRSNTHKTSLLLAAGSYTLRWVEGTTDHQQTLVVSGDQDVTLPF